MADGSCGIAADRGAGADHHRGGRVLVCLTEAAALGHDDVDAGSGDTGDLLDGASDFAFKRANPGDFLHEGGQAERADIVEEFITGIGAARQTTLGEQQTGLAGHADGNLDAATIGTDVEVDIGFCKRNADLSDVASLSPT